MKTTIELPSALVQRAKMLAVQRNSTFKELVIQGLESVLHAQAMATSMTLSEEESHFYDVDADGIPVLKKSNARVSNEFINNLRTELEI